jgi:hypothetical protein
MPESSLEKVPDLTELATSEGANAGATVDDNFGG